MNSYITGYSYEIHVLLLLALGIVQAQLLPHCSLDLSCQRVLSHKNP